MGLIKKHPLEESNMKHVYQVQLHMGLPFLCAVAWDILKTTEDEEEI